MEAGLIANLSSSWLKMQTTMLLLVLSRFRETTDSNALSKSEAIINMYPPGRMIYVRRMKYAEINRFYFDAVYIEPWEIIDEGILISKHM